MALGIKHLLFHLWISTPFSGNIPKNGQWLHFWLPFWNRLSSLYLKTVSKESITKPIQIPR
jgi:hypothetical protein